MCQKFKKSSIFIWHAEESENTLYLPEHKVEEAVNIFHYHWNKCLAFNRIAKKVLLAQQSGGGYAKGLNPLTN